MDSKNRQKVIIVGAGISGLVAAYYLDKKGFEVEVYEKETHAGGTMDTQPKDGFILDLGPNSGLETTPLIREICRDLGVEEEFVYANENANKRYILKNGELIPLPLNPKELISTKLFSNKAKLRLLLEPFIPPSTEGYSMSVAQFVTRRLGREILDYAIDPFVSGISAGDPWMLSVKSAFPKLYALEEKYGGLVKGLILGAKERKKRSEQSKSTAKMFSFKRGMHTIAAALEYRLKNKIHFGVEVEKVLKSDNGYKIMYLEDGVYVKQDCDILVLASPSYSVESLVSDIDAELQRHLREICYPPVIVMPLAYRAEAIKRHLDGFGFLIPNSEKKHFLGAIWSSSLFPNRAPDGSVLFTLFVGGARNTNIMAVEKEELTKIVVKEFNEIMGIEEMPQTIGAKLWKNAIPQYNIGHRAHEDYFVNIEKRFPGFYLTGNYRGGIALGDCFMNSHALSEKIHTEFQN